MVEILQPQLNLVHFVQNLCHVQHRALLLDYDGTLAPFCIQRHKATPYPNIREILETIIDLNHTRVVFVSGRWTKDLIPLLGLKRLPEIWGSNGLEHLMPDGTYELTQLDISTMEALAEAENLILKMQLASYCEKKPGSLALHWRGQSQEVIKEISDKVWSNLQAIAQQSELLIEEFDGGIELRSLNINKGLVVEKLLLEMGQDCGVVYLGDDFTDEDAFYAIKGKGLSVLVRHCLRPTLADLWLKPPDELLRFLKSWIELPTYSV